MLERCRMVQSTARHQQLVSGRARMVQDGARTVRDGAVLAEIAGNKGGGGLVPPFVVKIEVEGLPPPALFSRGLGMEEGPASPNPAGL